MTGRPLFPGRGFSAFLFDMDGTILTSIVAAERVWRRWAERHGLDADMLLSTIHGVRTVETIRRLALPGLDPQAEADAITDEEMDDVAGIDPIAGAPAFLAALPEHRWAVVTSAPRRLAERRMQAAGLPAPPLMIAAEDVENGKPAPDCFLLAARRLGCAAADCLVFEDTAAGLKAAQAAGAAAVVITATHRHPLKTGHPAIAGYEGLTPRLGPQGLLEL